jgi:hypothetical protein
MTFLYRLFYRGFLRYHESRKQPKGDMVYTFTDLEGRRYYTFNRLDMMPQSRRQELTDLLIAWQSAVDMPTLSAILQKASKIAKEAGTERDGNKQRQLLARLHVACSEIPLRFEKTLPMGIIIRAAAIMSIREDEDGMKFEDALTDEKERYFREELRNGHAFFLRNSQLKNYFDIWGMSRGRFLTQLVAWEKADRQVQAILTELT